MDGILNINKPAGVTSFAAVSAVKRLTGERRVGHAGTLDPLAEGVLPVCLGRGTRIQEFLLDGRKVYRAELKLGEETDTYDAEGLITRRADASSVVRPVFEEALKPFRGQIEQVPPMFSALKHRGQCLYTLARAGVVVERPARPVHIYRLELLEFENPVATIEVECSRGTYVRALAHDIGMLLGCGAHLRGLKRLKYGCFDIEGAVSLAEFEKACRHGYWRRLVYAPDTALLHWPALVVADGLGADVRHGRPVAFEEAGLQGEALSAGHCRVYGQDGSFLALMSFRADSNQWHPDKVFFGVSQENGAA